MSDHDPTPESLARSEETGSEDSVARTLHARRRSPAVAFLIGAALIGALAVAGYLVYGGRAETPASPAEAMVTDQALGLPAPDADAVRAQVDAALAQAPRDAAQPAEQAAASAQAQTAPEADDAPAAVETVDPDQAEAAIDRSAARSVEARQ